MRGTICLATSILLVACGGSNGESEITPDDFVNEVQRSTEANADSCGVVEPGDSQVDANTCVADAFVNGRAFHAVYWLEAFDTVEGAAITGDSRGEVILWRYTSNPTGGVPGSPAEFESDECMNASLSGSVDSGYDDVFLCE